MNDWQCVGHCCRYRGTLLCGYADFEYGHVRAYDLRGNLTAVVGKRGEGPGEFPLANQVNVTETGDETLLVVGASASLVSVFQQQDTIWTLKNTFTTAQPFMSGGLCSMHGHVYTIGYSEDAAPESDGIIHKYTMEGEHVMSFGTPYKDPSPFVRGSLAGRGTLECNATHRVIAYAHDLIPVITGFSDTGDVRWRVLLEDAHLDPAEQGRTAEGRLSMLMPSPSSEDGNTSAVRFRSGVESGAFVVWYYTFVSGRADKQHLFRVHAASGKGAYIGWLPMWKGGIEQPSVLALDAEYWYTEKSSPYPQLGIYRRTNAPQRAAF